MAFISTRKTFLKAAAEGDMKELTFCLSVRERFPVDCTDETGATPLLLAARNGRTEAVRALLKTGPRLELADAAGETPLFAAVKTENTGAARLLIAAGANPETHDENYVTPLIMAAREGFVDVVGDLIGRRANLEAISRATGRTALHWAIENEHGPVVELLMKAGARTDIADRDGKTALDIALAKSPRILKIMRAAAPGLVVPEPPAPPPPAPEPAPEPAKNDAAAKTGDSDVPAAEPGWSVMGKTAVAHVLEGEALGRRITQVFNFESRERLIISENLKTGAETMGTPEKFDTLAPELVQHAEAQLRMLSDLPPKKSFTL